MNRNIEHLITFCCLAALSVVGCGDDGTNSAGGTGGDGGSGGSIDMAVCSDDSLGSGTTQAPVANGELVFTTALEDCSLSQAEAELCYGASHQSNITVADGVRTVTGNAIPNHDVDLFPNSGNPNVVSAQTISYSMTTSPSRTATATSARTPGVGINGIKFEPETAERYSDTAWSYEALTFGGRLDGDTSTMPDVGTLGLDCNFAHVQPTGEYHYHGVATGLMPTSPEITLVGWASDGYPILGRYGYETPGDTSSAIVELTGGYRLRTGTRQALSGTDSPPGGDYDGTFVQDWEYDDSVGDLDECNGRAETITIDGETFDYAYYVTYTYPFMQRCVWGTPDSSFGAGRAPPM